MRILLVDDDDDMRGSIAACLADRQHEVRSYVTAREALAVMEFYEPELVISDIQMPGIGGIELLNQIRKRDAEVPVILMTSEQSVESVISALRGGANDYLKKPIVLKELLACIDRIRGESSDGAR